MDKFDTIDYAPLRIWNRAVMFFNIMEDSGQEAAREYVQQFTQQEKEEMLDLYFVVKKLGSEEVKRRIIFNMPAPEEDPVHPENNVRV